MRSAAVNPRSPPGRTAALAMLEQRCGYTLERFHALDLLMKIFVHIASGVLLLVGCSASSRSPDAIRHDTAVATAAATRDAKAVAQGVFEGLRTKGPMNLNRATPQDLETLPGIDAATARRIVAGRPYENSAELVKRHIVSRAEYERIASKVEAR